MMFNFKNYMKKFVGIATISTLVLSLLVPSLSFGRQFSTDENLVVYPSNEILDFGAVNVGHSVTKNFVIENNSLTEREISLATFPNGDFTHVGPRTFVVPAQEEVLLPIMFEPSSTGVKETEFAIRSKNTNERKMLTLVGEATSNANNGLEISTSQINFAQTPVGHTAVAEVSITNRNNRTVRVDIDPTGSSDFRLRNSQNIMLHANETQNVQVVFEPTSALTQRGALVIEASNNPLSEIIVDLVGPGLNGSLPHTETSAAEFSIDSNIIGLGTVTVHQQRSENIFFTNTGSETLYVDLTEGADEPFLVDLGGNRVERTIVQPGQRGTIRVSFRPDYQGAYTSSFTLTTNAENAPEVTLGVTGSAVNAGESKFDFNVDANLSEKDIFEGGRTVLTYTTNIPSKNRVVLKKDGRTVEVLKEGNSYEEPNETHRVLYRADNVAPGRYTIELTARSNDGQSEVKTKSFDVMSKNKREINLTRNPSDRYFNLPNPSINIDNNEKAYFNFYTPARSSVVYTIKSVKTGKVVLQRAYANIEAGTHNYNISWNGRSHRGNKVSEGDYTFEFKIEPNSVHHEVRIYKGHITVSRNESRLTHVSEPIVSRVGSHVPQTPTRVISSYYTTDLRNNENLITEAISVPSNVTEFNQSAVISFNTLHDGIATASVKDLQGNLVRKLTKERRLVDGYHHQELVWFGDTSQGTAAYDGRYKIEIHTAQGNESDTDTVWVTLNRGHQAPYVTPTRTYPTNTNRVNAVRSYAPSYAGSCNGFSDVYGTDRFCEAVSFVVDQGIFEGSVQGGQKVLRPDDYLTRAEATAVVIRVMNLQVSPYNQYIDGNLGFTDLDTSAWYMSHIKTIIKSATQQQSRYGAWVKNIMQGYPDGTIRPNKVMSRAEFYKVFLEAAKNSAAVNANFNLDYNVTEAPFSDTAVNELTSWYLPYADWAQNYLNNTEFAAEYFDSANLHEGVRRFKGKKGITRGEVINLIYTTQGTGVIQY